MEIPRRQKSLTEDEMEQFGHQFEILEYGHDSFKGCWAIEKIVPLKIEDLL